MRQKNHVLILLSWIHDILLFEGIYVLAAAIRHTEDTAIAMVLLKGFLMLVPVVLSYLVICRCRNLWIFLLFSAAITWGMKSVSQSILTGILTAFVCLSRCYVKLKEAQIRRMMREMPGEAGISEDKETWEVSTLLDAPRIPYCLIFIAMYLILIYLHRYEFLPLMLGMLAAEFCICLAYCYLERLDIFMKSNARVANLPTSAMKRIGTGIVLTGITILILFMLPAAIYHEEPLSRIKFEPQDMGDVTLEYFEENTEPDPMMEELMRLKEHAKETPEWLKKASDLLAALTVIGIAYVVLRLIFKAIRKAMESFSYDEEDDEIIFLDQETDNTKGRINIFKKPEKEGWLSPDRKIRKLYKKLIRRALREKPCGNETPLELENKAGLYEKGEERADMIHALYEKARYGKTECTREDARQYADILSRLGR